MDVYETYAKGHSRTPTMMSGPEPTENSTPSDTMIINPLAGRLEITNTTQFTSKTTEEWINIFPNAAYFSAYDDTLFGYIVTMIYENPATNKICTASVTKFGITLYQDLILTPDSRFYPACENLLPVHRDSKVRKALAITNLKNYNKLVNHPGSFVIDRRWDETNAGELASKMSLLVDKRPNEFGIKLLQMGLLSNHEVSSLMMDTVYNNSPSTTDQKIVDDNNKLVCLLGDQLDQLFDPLLEYSPETLETSYNVPRAYEPPSVASETIDNIVAELIQVQTNFTTGLVGLLQNFIIPLRVHILSLSDSQGITKINHIFPPTIDEITRINCVLHDSLSRAMPFGYVEIIKVFGMILPYFYKPFVRHEANLKNFKARFDRFHDKYNHIFQDEAINKEKYSHAYIDSVVTGSLLELPRLKLILMRLYSEVEKGRSQKGYKAKNETDTSVIDYYYKTAISVIDAFGGEDEEKEHQRSTSQRIFTPTGKLLTELAGNWPVELQYGWLTRKVIGIFEIKNVKPLEEPFYDDEVLIIFSDHLLFLKIVDDQYYAKENLNDGSVQLRISDVLMHSLVNEKPLPQLSTFPKMVVSHWCDIDDVVASTYKSFSFITSSEESFLRFVKRQKIEGSDESILQPQSYHYEVQTPASGHQILELITKSQILHKTKPFHLFRTPTDLHIYTTAHSASSYDEEKTRSPIILLLNMPESMISHYFNMNPYLFLVLSATYTYDGDIQMIGFNRDGGTEVNIVVPDAKFQATLINVLKKFVNCYFNSYGPMTKMMINATEQDLGWYLQTYQGLNGYEVRERFKRSAKKSISSAAPVPVTEPARMSGFVPQGKKEQAPVPHQKQVEAPKKKRRSFFKRLFGKKEPKELEYKELYRPTPKLTKDTPSPVIPAANVGASDPVDTEEIPSGRVTPEIEPDLTRYDSQADTIHYNPKPEPQEQPASEEQPDLGEEDDKVEEIVIRDVEAAKQHQAQDPAHKRVSSQAEYFQHDLPSPTDSNSRPLSEISPVIPVSSEFYPKTTSTPFKELYDSGDTLEYMGWTGVSSKKEEPKTEELKAPTLPEKPAPIVATVPMPIKVMPTKQRSPPAPQLQQKSAAKTPAPRTLAPGRSSLAQPNLVPRQQPVSQPTVSKQPVVSQQMLPKTAAVVKPKSNQASLDVTSNFEFPSPKRANFSEAEEKFQSPPEPKSSRRSIELESELKSANTPKSSYPASTIRQVDTADDVSVFGPYFYEDEEANWIQFSRESSSNSLAKERKEPTRLQFPPRLTSFNSSVHSRLEDATFATKIRSREVSAAESFKSQIVYFNSQVGGRNESTHSLSTASFVNEFSREIDFNFKSAKADSETPVLEAPQKSAHTDTIPKKIDSVFTESRPSLAPAPIGFNPQSSFHPQAQSSFQPLSVEKQRKRGDVYDADEVPRRYSGMTSSEDEFYSIDGSPNNRVQRSPVTPSNANGSFSSENTIINELLQEPKTDIYINQFESMAYLSDVLNGKVNFDI